MPITLDPPLSIKQDPPLFNPDNVTLELSPEGLARVKDSGIIAPTLASDFGVTFNYVLSHGGAGGWATAVNYSGRGMFLCAAKHGPDLTTSGIKVIVDGTTYSYSAGYSEDDVSNNQNFATVFRPIKFSSSLVVQYYSSSTSNWTACSVSFLTW
jgi:hypothetical protein